MKQIRDRNFSVSVEFKVCNECKVQKTASEFHKCKSKKTGLFPDCKECRKAHSKASYTRRRDKVKKQANDYYHANKEMVAVTKKVYQNNKLQTDPFFRVCRNLRNRLYYALKNTVWKKNSNFTKYIGCDRDTLISHLESQFSPGMTWDNYGEWHIDYKIPLVSAMTEEELYKLCHFQNLQPMWALDNLKKAGKL